MTDTTGGCWVLRYPDGTDGGFLDDDTPHFRDEAEALDAAITYGFRDSAGTRPTPRQLDEPCVPALTCATCWRSVEDDDYDGIPHYASQADAEQVARSAGWTVTRTAAWCPGCAPDAPPEPERVPSAGQLTLETSNAGGGS